MASRFGQLEVKGSLIVYLSLRRTCRLPHSLFNISSVTRDWEDIQSFHFENHVAIKLSEFGFDITIEGRMKVGEFIDLQKL
jgi:hypothetical protein